MAANQTMAASQSRLGWVQYGIIFLSIATALIHLFLGASTLMKGFDPLALLFVLNFIGYLVLMAGLFVQVPFAQQNRSLIRWALIAFAAVTIAGWLAIGDKSWPAGALGYLTKAIEVVLIVLLFMDRGRS